MSHQVSVLLLVRKIEVPLKKMYLQNQNLFLEVPGEPMART